LPPQLPQLLPQLLEGIEQIPTVQRLVGQVMEAYEEILTAMKGDRAALVPDLALDMAEALVSVNRGYAQSKLNYALSSWLKFRTNQTAEGSSLLRLVGEAMGESDRSFLNRLQQLYRCIYDSLALVEVRKIEQKLDQRRVSDQNQINEDVVIGRKVVDVVVGKTLHDVVVGRNFYDVLYGSRNTSLGGFLGRKNPKKRRSPLDALLRPDYDDDEDLDEPSAPVAPPSRRW
jgi:hypothetical protein